MKDYLFRMFQGTSDFTPGEIIGGLSVGLVLALICTGLYFLIYKKLSDPTPLLCGLVLLACAFSMMLGAAHAVQRLRRGAPFAARAGGEPPPRSGRRGPEQAPPLGRVLLRAADSDGDGKLTPEEAAEYIRKIDVNGKGWVDAGEIDRARGPVAGRTAPVALQPVAPPPVP